MTFKYKPQQQNPSMADVAAELEKARKAAQAQTEATALKETPKPIEQKASTKPLEYIKPELCTERIRIIFDDSGSMSGDKITDARDGVIEFMRNCVPNQVAIAIHPMNAQVIHMDSNLPLLSKKVKQIDTYGGTPMFETWVKAQLEQPTATRFVIFSDGEPNNTTQKEACIQYCIKNKITCDTILLTDGAANVDSREYRLLKEIADRTLGMFMVFDRNKMDFRTGFKYLAPTNRLALNAPGMKEALQEGRLK